MLALLNKMQLEFGDESQMLQNIGNQCLPLNEQDDQMFQFVCSNILNFEHISKDLRRYVNEECMVTSEVRGSETVSAVANGPSVKRMN